MKAYFELDRLVAQVKEMIPKNTLLMIVSDHGVEAGGHHSPKAFYSFNIDPEWKPRRIK